MLFLFVQASVLLGAALVLGRIATRCGLPAVSGELTAGLVLGPSLLGWVAPDAHRWFQTTEQSQGYLLEAVAQFGVVLLVGITAVEIDLGLVRRSGRSCVTIGALGLVLPLGLGWVAGFAAPGALVPHGVGRPLFAFFVGVAMCVSALPVIAKMLADLRLLHRDVAQLTIAVGVVDDVAGWMLLSVAAAAAAGGLTVGSAAWPVLRLVLVVIAAAVLLRPALRWLLARVGTAQTAMALATVVIVGCAAATHALGLEASLGALLAGMVLGVSGSDTLRRLAPLRAFTLSVLAPLYFAEAGLRMDLTALRDPVVAAAALGALVVACAGKFAGALLGARVAGLGRPAAMFVAAGTNARGVIQIIVAGIGLRLGVLNTSSYTVVVLVAVVTSLMAPPVLRRAVAHLRITDEERSRLNRTAETVTARATP